MKVFCKDCKWLDEEHTTGFIDDTVWIARCIHKSNLIEKPTWYRLHHRWIESPKVLNKNNDCGNYCKKKEKKIKKPIIDPRKSMGYGS